MRVLLINSVKFYIPVSNYPNFIFYHRFSPRAFPARFQQLCSFIPSPSPSPIIFWISPRQISNETDPRSFQRSDFDQGVPRFGRNRGDTGQ